MYTKLLISWIIIGCCGVVVTMTTGCARWIELEARPESASEHSSQQIARSEQVPLVLDHVQITRNGSPQNPTTETEQRLLGSIREISLFSHLEGTAATASQPDEKVVHARLLFDESIDPHAGDAAWKGILIGASMFLLTPFVPLEYDYAAHVTLELERWDGQIKRYESQSAGTARYHLFGATPIVLDELKGHVTESCLVALTQQLIQDTSFYFASSAPISNSGIHTVSIKPRPAKLPSKTPGSIPVSVQAGP